MSSLSKSASAYIWLLSYQHDPIAYLCQHLVTKFKEQLPDLTDITILMPDTHAAVQFRHQLTRAAHLVGCPALLGPNIQTLRSFIDHNPDETAMAIIPKASRELMLVEALREYPQLYGKSSPWLLAENLLQLFDELSQQQVVLPDDFDSFTAQIKQAYCIPDSAPAHIEEQLSQEAKLVYTLWRAWQQQLADENSIDQHQCYIAKLANYIPANKQQLFLLGYSQFLPAEQQWFSRLAEQGKAVLILQGCQSYTDDKYHSSNAIKDILDNNVQQIEEIQCDHNAYEHVLEDIYAPKNINIATRAETISHQYPDSPLQEKLSILAADSAEQEVLGIELQIRHWLHEGKKNIGVVTQDRRLARRLRALLERTHITLRDYTGWALSTTSAAAALERWLECIEQDFNHLPLLDLLKSSFAFASTDREQVLYQIYRFEQDIILHENISENIYRYKSQIERRAKRIDAIWTTQLVSALHGLLDKLDDAAKPLQKLRRGKHNPLKFLDALLTSMQDIEMLDGLAGDAAGQRILDEINSMRLSVSERDFSISWSEFRHWLGRTLERYSFVPPFSTAQVQLLDLNSSLLCRFDALIIAAADAEYLPGRVRQSAFFNDAVRHSLKLKTANEHSASLFYHYRCLLHSAPTILLSYSTDNDGNTNLASPWLECLRHYHEIAWHNRLDQQQLVQWLNSHYSGYSHQDTLTTPSVVSQQHATACEIDLLPIDISASGYQQLLNCPYQFFGARCLALKATDEIRLVLEKSDYGSRVHRCLQAFHSDIEYLPGPFLDAINKDNRAMAIECLMDISTQLFARDLEDNFQHRGWLQTWQQLIPMYIDWQIAHEHSWSVTDTEQMRSHELRDSFNLKGVLDRVDHAGDDIGIIDYKTGNPPSQKDINNGEAVQLPFYALLLGDTINQVEYLMLNDGKVRTSGILEQSALHDLIEAHTQRLTELFTQLNAGEKLPAWGDSKTCSYCDMDGLCRRGAWELAQ